MLRRGREAWRLLSRREEDRVPPGAASNFDVNRSLWESYAEDWTPESVRPEDGTRRPLHLLGDEWGRPEDVEEIVATEIVPFVNRSSRVAEIGIGGGRIAARVAPHVGELVGFDVSPRMLERASSALADRNNVRYILLTRPRLPGRFREAFDFLYAFDVFVHMDLHTMWKYFREIRRVLKGKGRAFVHTANLATEGGWRRFAAQDRYSVEGHYFVSPEIVMILARKAGLEVLPAVEPRSSNFYRQRDGFFRLTRTVGPPVGQL